MTVQEIADITGLSVRAQEKALQDVVAIGWMGFDLAGGYRVERFEEKAGSDSELESNRERQRRFRQRKRNGSNALRNDVTDTLRNESSNNQNVTDIDVEEDVEEDILPEIPKVAEADVVVYLANAAAENKTNKITDSRAAGLRRELQSLLAELGEPAFIAGLREANARGVANRTYVKKCASSTSRRPDAAPKASRYKDLA